MEDVTVYSTPTCTYCKQVKDFLDEHGITYTEHNVAEDVERRQEMVEKSGQMGVPVTVIGDTVLTGFDQSKFAEALGVEK